MDQKTFENFTNQYELSKTLRFELKPVGKTQKMLEENSVFEKDKFIQKNIRKLKNIYYIRGNNYPKNKKK